MFTSIKLILVLILVTCFIAYWSDNLGKKLGKKRISFLGLRPRQTATAITMASSCAIMLVTLLVVSLLDRNTRQALWRFDSINKESQRLQKRLPLLLASNQTLEKKNKTMQQSAVLVNANVASLRQQSTKLTEQNNKYQKSIADNKVQLQDVRQGEAQALESAKSARQSEKAARQNESQYRQRVEVEQNRLAEAQQQLGQKQQLLKQLNAQLDTTKVSLSQVKYELSAARTQVAATMRGNRSVLIHTKELTQQDADLEQALKQKQATVSSLEEQRKTLDAKVSDLQTKVNDLEAKAADWRNKWYRAVGERDELASLGAPGEWQYSRHGQSGVCDANDSR